MASASGAGNQNGSTNKEIKGLARVKFRPRKLEEWKRPLAEDRLVLYMYSRR